ARAQPPSDRILSAMTPPSQAQTSPGRYSVTAGRDSGLSRELVSVEGSMSINTGVGRSDGLAANLNCTNVTVAETSISIIAAQLTAYRTRDAASRSKAKAPITRTAISAPCHMK